MYSSKPNKDGNTEMTLAEKEEEIRDYYDDDEELEEYEDELERVATSMRNIDIFFTILIIIIVLIGIDSIAVDSCNKGPFFAIPIVTHDDGGTKEYYGLGYKVIKYNQTQGRRDKEIGLWSLKYNTEPLDIEDKDIINEANPYEKYRKKFVRITSKLQEIDKSNHKIIMKNNNTLTTVCQIKKKKKDISNLEIGKETTIIGTVTDYLYDTETTEEQLFISDCFAEQ